MIFGTKTSCKPLTQELKSKGHNGTLYSLVYNCYNSTDKPSQVLRTWTQSGICTGVDFGGGLGMGNRFCHGYHDAVSCNHLQMHLVWKDPYETMSQVEQTLDPVMSPESHPRAPNGSWVFCHGGALSFAKCLTSQTPSFFLGTSKVTNFNKEPFQATVWLLSSNQVLNHSILLKSDCHT